jgi:carbamoyltransferase
MNVKAMMHIAGLREVDELFVCPTPSDESLAIGAAYMVMHDAVKARGGDPSKVLKPLPHAYLGPAPARDEIAAILREFAGDDRYRIHEKTDPATIASLLVQGKIVGRCAGRSEFGARALGNRSILADPRNIGVIRRINESIKSRDFWMPFAPSIKAERADDYLANRKGMRAPYMTMAFPTTPLAQKELTAGLHQADLTCRPQIVDRAQNVNYHEMITAFERLTGVGGVLNTSFNLHGEPIVQTPADAARVYRLSQLDALLLETALIEKLDVPQKVRVDQQPEVSSTSASAI